MNLNSVTAKTGLTKRMLRHYEQLGLIKPSRSANNYRDYSDVEVRRLLAIKALKGLGFSLVEIKGLLKVEDSEDALSAHLQRLLSRREEAYVELKDSIRTIKKLIKTESRSIPALLDQIAVASYSQPLEKETETLGDFFERNDAIAGGLKLADDLAEIATLGPDHDFRIQDVDYAPFVSVFNQVFSARVSLCSSRETHSLLTLFTDTPEKFDKSFHKTVWSQFSDFWGQVSYPMTVEFEALTVNVDEVESLFGAFDIAMILKARNPQGESLEVVVPCQPLNVFLSQKGRLEWSEGPMKIRPVRI